MDVRLIVSMIETLRREQADLDRVIAGFEELAIANGNGSSTIMSGKSARSDTRLPGSHTRSRPVARRSSPSVRLARKSA